MSVCHDSAVTDATNSCMLSCKIILAVTARLLMCMDFVYVASEDESPIYGGL